ncbi:MAG: 1-deoxy-D-xylulose-5-phosphate synthase, partial [Betaproteobacteria bacterium]|nr:1-deoxy-D-xylulose-5-phosphate synthase [Betaproteobacteria bacterium]
MATDPLLESIDSPMALRQLRRAQLPALAEALRAFVLESVSQTGGHLAANLGTVELAIALHYVFDTPKDRLVWDVGHQAYPHKILTGRRKAMSSLKQWGGLSGFPKRSESEYDTFGTGHSSTSISAALGMALASRAKGEHRGPQRRRHVAVIGDGAMSAGMAFEALNNAGVHQDLDLLVILNDNDMSISPAVGALNRYLARLLSGGFYARAKDMGKAMLSRMPEVLDFARRVEEHAKGLVIPGTLFEEFGFNYVGPIDGHDLDSLVPTLQNMRQLRGPQFLHIVTRKGKGYELAERDPVLYHGPGKFDPDLGIVPSAKKAKPSYTQIFSAWICDQACLDSRLVAITPAKQESASDLKALKHIVGLNAWAASPWITHRCRALMHEAGMQHLTALILVRRRHDQQIRNAAQVGKVVSTSMGCPIGSNQACPVERKKHRQVLNRNIMD